MERTKCFVADCIEQPLVYVIRAERYYRTATAAYCGSHADDGLREATRPYFTNLPNTRTWRVERCAVDIELLVCDMRDDWPCKCLLREIGGARWMAFDTGRFEAWNLAWELDHISTPAVSTHQAMASLVNSLEGKLTDVTINDVVENERYLTQLHVLQKDKEVLVDLRVSDALVLAAISEIPISIEKQVWEKLLASQEQRRRPTDGTGKGL